MTKQALSKTVKVAKKVNTLILGRFSPTGSNALDMILLALILICIGSFIYLIVRKKKTKKNDFSGDIAI